MKKTSFFTLLLLSLLGLSDAGYLTWEHYANVIPPCSGRQFLSLPIDCGAVLKSKYAVVFGLPLSLLGVFHYGLLVIIIVLAAITKKRFFQVWMFLQSGIGAFVSLYLIFLQLVVIKSICLYCTLSAFVSFIIAVLAYLWLDLARKTVLIYATAGLYQFILKPILFQIDPETVHQGVTSFGEIIGGCGLTRGVINSGIRVEDNSLSQTVAGIKFDNPIGLAAGFDYQAKLPKVLSAIGFGFGTVGTVTNMACKGNPKPRLGRLPRSKSLMVNKGFKSPGAKKMIKKLEKIDFDIPVGISIGRTNSRILKSQKASIKDIISGFILFEKSPLAHSYYELNISCPNLFSHINFYSPKNLCQLLTELEKLSLTRPVFVKMPIAKTNRQTLAMLEVISRFKIKGVIFGNLQTNRNDPSLDKEEVKKFKTGNFSGKPTEKRSNELIKLTYKHYKERFIIIGCGGVFSGEDAYRKIRLGASLVQLITGLVFKGPQLAAEINLQLINLLKKDGFKSISQAVGVDLGRR